MRDIRVITDQDRIAKYGVCTVCGAPRDVYEVAIGSIEDRWIEMRLVCTASVRPNLAHWDDGHTQA